MNVGRVIRVEWNAETDEVRIIMDITDPTFKLKVIHNKDFADVLSISGKDVMAVASKREDE